MKKNPAGKDLRKRAEEFVSRLDRPREPIDPGKVKSLLHELEVYQAELEMQNEQLVSAQLEIEESRRRYADLYDYAPVGYITLDQAGLILEANLTGSALLGTERKSLLGKPFLNFVAPASRNFFLAHVKDLSESGGKQACEVILLRGRREAFYARLESLAEPDGSGGANRVLSAVIDITDRKKAEEERNRAFEELEDRVKERTASLLKANERITSVLSSITDAFLSLDPDGKIADINEVAAGMFRRQREELIGKDFRDEYPEENNPEFYRNFRLAVAGGRPVHFEAGGGTDRWLEVHAYPRGRTLEIYFRDITERRKSEQKIRESEAKLRKSHSQLKDLMHRMEEVREEERAVIARELHDELGQVLTGFSMDVSWLLNRLPPERDDLIRKTQFMKSYIVPAVDLIRRVSTELRPGILDDAGLVATIEWQLQIFRTRTGIGSEFHSDINETELDDRLKIVLFRVVQESLTNIIKHSEATHVKVSLVQNKSDLRLKIEDNGKGVRQQDLRKKRSSGIRGMKERIAAFNGQYSIKGEPGHGTVLEISIPLFEKDTPEIQI